MHTDRSNLTKGTNARKPIGKRIVAVFRAEESPLLTRNGCLHVHTNKEVDVDPAGWKDEESDRATASASS